MSDRVTAPSITEFLIARIAEDDAVARAAAWVPDPDEPYDDYDNPWAKDHGEFASRGGARFTHILRNDPARVLAECAAKRAIIEQAAPALNLIGGFQDTVTEREYMLAVIAKRSIRTLAAVHADHPDYSPEWAL